jgi:hypothetical protein
LFPGGAELIAEEASTSGGRAWGGNLFSPPTEHFRHAVHPLPETLFLLK